MLRDDGGRAYAIYHAAFSTLTGGEPILRDKHSTWRLWSPFGRAF